MNFTQIRAFHHVALAGGFSRAAEALGLTQPAISDQVAALEQAHDVLLFERRGRQVRLTEKGAALLKITRQLFEHVGQVDEFLAETAARHRGELRLIADSALHVSALLGRFVARHPGVRVMLRAGNSAEVRAALESWEADIGVLGERVRGGRFEAVSLGAAPLIAFAARDLPGVPEGPCALAELLRLPLVLREEGSRTRALLQAEAAAQGLRLSPAIEAEGREAVRQIVMGGGGVGFVSEAEFEPDRRLVAIPIAGGAPMMAETMLCLRQRRDVPNIRAFMELARS